MRTEIKNLKEQAISEIKTAIKNSLFDIDNFSFNDYESRLQLSIHSFDSKTKTYKPTFGTDVDIVYSRVGNKMTINYGCVGHIDMLAEDECEYMYFLQGLGVLASSTVREVLFSIFHNYTESLKKLLAIIENNNN